MKDDIFTIRWSYRSVFCLFRKKIPLRAQACANVDKEEARRRSLGGGPGRRKKNDLWRTRRTEGRRDARGEGCSRYKRAVARGATRLPTFSPLSAHKRAREKSEVRTWWKEMKRKDEGRTGGGGGEENVHLIHPSTVPSFLLLLMIACTLPPSMRCIGQQQQRWRQQWRQPTAAAQHPALRRRNIYSGGTRRWRRT